MKNNKVFIWDIQRFNIHDGPGIRTLIFLKGCPLSCKWCSNPEGQKRSKELLYKQRLCQYCGTCYEVCSQNAIKFGEMEEPKINREACQLCGECVENCPNQALQLVGRYSDIEEVIEEVKKDSVFYWRSKGGVTLSGGEPAEQIEASTEILRKLQNLGFHTAVETSGYTSRQNIKTLSSHTNLFLYDLKLINNKKHKRLTGKANNLIIENLKFLTEKAEAEVILRTPVIPEINDQKNLKLIAELAAELQVKRWDLIPYHRLGIAKYRQLGLKYGLSQVSPPSDELLQNKIEKLKDIYSNIHLENR